MNKVLLYKVLGGVVAIGVVALLGLFAATEQSKNTVTSGLPAQVGDALPGAGQVPATPQAPVFHYIEVMDGCDWSYTGACVNMRSGPGTNYPVVTRLRIGVVLKVEATTTVQGGLEWYKIIFDGDIRYPERVAGNWYVAADATAVRPFEDAGDSEAVAGVQAPTTKRIVVDISKEMLYAYDGSVLFMQDSISTGLEFTPTPLGTFSVYKKTPSRYMQGPIPGVSDQYYDLPGVPWDLYFSQGGAVIHGAYWHNHFGEPWSHGCVNLPSQEAKKLYEWADVGTPVIVQP